MKKTTPPIDIIFEVLNYGAKNGAMHLNTIDKKLNNNTILLDRGKEKEVINFGSCSYLGLEFDGRLRQAAKDAIDNYGTQFSSSRAYVSNVYYNELESLLSTIFDAHAIVTPTTTLGHIGVIPVLVNDKDAIILDHQVHTSVHTAVNLVKTKGVHTELIRHNRIDILEERIKTLRQKHSKIWYMADGVYSMYGDLTPIDEIYALMDKYPELHYYVDDAHGMSWCGRHGRGAALKDRPMHEKMVLLTSLNKAFAAGGGVAVFPTKEMAHKVRTCATSLVTSGPMQPSGLAAAIAAAKIHLSPDIYAMQEQLNENIKYTNLVIKKYGLPLVSESTTPIFFVGVSLPKIGYSIINRMIDDGFYVNAGIFPGVPIKNTGIRFTITRLHTFQQIENMVAALAHHHAEVLKEENFPISKIYQAFKMKEPVDKLLEEIITTDENKSGLEIQHATSITEIDKKEWDSLLGDRGSYDWNGINFLEKTFTGNEIPENNWQFDYIIIRDKTSKPILATFLTTALWKDDMLAPEGVSVQVEAKRKAMNDPYYLTSKLVAMGSLLTEGDHLYIDRDSALWKTAMNMLLEKMSALQEKNQATGTLLRDLRQGDEEMDNFLMDNGYFKVGMPATHVIDTFNWSNREEFVANLSTRSRRHIRRDVMDYADKYDVEILKNATQKQIEHLYSLYLNVKSKSLLLNTFQLPYSLFENMVSDPNWEVMTLTLKAEYDKREERKPVAVVFCYASEEKYNPMIVGIDYSFQEEYKCYKQAVYRVIKRARLLGKKAVNLGLSASTEKQKYGAKVVEIVAYMQAKDNYSLEVVSSINVVEEAANSL